MCDPGRVLGAMALAGLAVGCVDPVHREASWTAMDRPVHAEVFASTDKVASITLREIQRLTGEAELLLVADDEDRGLGRLNARAGEEYYPVEDRDLYRCLLLALDWAKASRGAYDPTVGPLTDLYALRVRPPSDGSVDAALRRVGWDQVTVAEEARAVRFRLPGMRLDLGGIAEGFALDMAKRAFARTGNTGALLGLGGSFYAWGQPPEKDFWSVVLPDPRRPGEPLVEVDVANRALAVSGHGDPSAAAHTGESPILDAATGRPAASDVIAAVAIADSAGDADAISTALVVLGSRSGGDLLARASRVEAVMLVERNGAPELLVSASLAERIRVPPRIDAEIEGRVRYLLPPQRVR